jgi:23S rRNA (cytidine2498-2'-O)-methyltransferase
VALAGEAWDVEHLAAVAAKRPELVTAQVDGSRPFSVQSRVLAEGPYKPFDLNQALSQVVVDATGAALDVRSPEQVVSLAVALLPLEWAGEAARLGLTVVAPRGSNTGLFALLGVSPVAQNLSAWAGGMRRFAREDGQVSRSEFKLLEAIELFGIQLPERGVALDLGASPGGWTRVLRNLGQYVTAVDPGELDPRVSADPGVRHKRLTAEEYLRSEPDRFDIIVNDMRMDARDSARLMLRFAPLLYAHGLALMTLKLPQEQRAPIVEHALTLLRGGYDVVGARQLFHNRSEITVVLKPKARPDGAIARSH